MVQYVVCFRKDGSSVRSESNYIQMSQNVDSKCHHFRKQLGK